MKPKTRWARGLSTVSPLLNIEILCSAAVALALGSGNALAASQDGATIAKKGAGNDVPACQSCHGADGGGQDATGFPRLAGLNARYMDRQLNDMADGSRKSPVMQPIATALSKTQRRAVSEYYSKLSIPASAASGKSEKADALGKHLALHGHWAQQVPGCVQCHGPHGVGVGAHFPPLAGQPAKYIDDQMHAFKTGERHNDPLDLMEHVASALDDDDIKAVSQWFAAQPAQLEEDAQ